MPIFAVQYTYSEATAAGRDVHRPRHRAWLTEHLATDTLLSSGPYTDGSGALLLFRAENGEALSRLLSADPFAVEDLIDDVRVVEWHPVLGAFAPH